MFTEKPEAWSVDKIVSLDQQNNKVKLMLAILKKELNLFFATPIGYLVIAIFLLINGLVFMGIQR